MHVSEMIARNSRMYPNETALVEIDPTQKTRKVLTWKEFDTRINKVANALIDRGIEKGDKIHMLMYNRIEILEIQLGAMRAGAWIAPLNFRFTGQEIVYCADVAEAKMMILEGGFLKTIREVQSSLPAVKHYINIGENTPEDMEDFEEVMANSSEVPVAVETDDNEGCALYFTSGTTGKPKPILLTNKNFECAAITNNYNWNIKHNDNFLLLQPLYHAGGGMMWVGCVVVGAPAVLIKGMIKPIDVVRTVQSENVSILFMVVPWALDILGHYDRKELTIEDHDMKCCRILSMGGQPVPPSVIERWLTYFPHMEYDTMYGLGEAMGPGCCHLTSNDPKRWGGIGKASFNWEARIVNEKGEDVPRGQVGELIVQGNGVMKEYYKNPEKTAETLRNGWIFTGDMAKADDEGYLFLVDRKKDVIIYGGENIYPVEIEDLLQTHPKIHDVGVIGIPDVRLGEVVAAVIQVKPGETMTEEEVHQFCADNLPKYKRPKHIFFDKVPRNPTGKIEKPGLRAKYAGFGEMFKVK
jgi:acyl-CoA synthetase (AMP-forming)/AMP-acid ligase II